MTRKHRRLAVLAACLLGLGGATALTLTALSDNMVFFVAPSDLASKPPRPGRSFRIGGLVEPGSVSQIRQDGKPVMQFRVTDGKAAATVYYAGVLPDLFREGQGVVVLGMLRPDGEIAASEVLAKHDETYMPPEVADALKKAGQWTPTATPQAKPAMDFRPATPVPAKPG